MIKDSLYNPGKRFARFMMILGLIFAGMGRSFAGGEGETEKITPNFKLSYKISDGKPSVKVELTYKEGKKFIPVSNIIVNLYLTEVRKFNPVTGEGWMGNLVTDDDGIVEFDLSDNFKRIKTGAHVFTFIASIGTDPKFENSSEQIVMNDVRINLSSKTVDSLIQVTAKLSMFKDSVEVPAAKTEMKLLIKRSFGALPFGEDNLSTDENGEVSGVLPNDIPGNADKTLTILAKYEDQENDGVIEVTKNIPWSIPPIERTFAKRTLWSSGQNAPVPLVIVSVTIIFTIWGIIFYLISLLFKIKKLR